jgi:TRAP-type mannitol/chloroaromatic compound transport system permease small subunit
MNAWLDRITGAFAWLVLPLALLLCAQWPLRDLAGAGSRQANDLAQCLFALYVAAALRIATRTDAHLRADVLAQRYPASLRRWLAGTGHAIAVLPFALYVLIAGAPMTWVSLRGLEAFPDTFNPGYFTVKAAAWLLALLMALQALCDLRASPAR